MKNRVLKKAYPMWATLPSMVIYTVFFIIPILIAFFYSCTNWNMDRIHEPVFNGLYNFVHLFQDGIFLTSIKNTFLFALATTLLKTVVGLGLALVLVKKIKGNRIYRTLFYMPCVLSAMIVGLLFIAILRMDGLLNNLLGAVGLEQLACDWLGKYGTAMFWIIMVEVWMWAGFCMFIFIAGLQAIPKDYYECAGLEGAGRFAQFIHITLPLLVPSFTVVITLNITGGLRVFDLVYALTGGGPGFDTQVLTTYTYKAFGLGLLGKSSASALVLSVLVVIITVFINKLLKAKEVEA